MTQAIVIDQIQKIVSNHTSTQPPSAEITVVLNDTTKPDSASQTCSAPKAKDLSDMEAKRQQWETTAYRTSNQQLYAVLADCLAYGDPDGQVKLLH